MKALVTGVAGFIGSHLAERLLKEGFDVIGIDNLSFGHIENVPEEVDFHEIDLVDTVPSELTNVDYVFHLASIARNQYCTEHPLESSYANIVGTLNLLEASREHKPKFVLCSSCVADSPTTPYALTKTSQEAFVSLWGNIYGIEWVVLKPFNVYGAGQSEKGEFPNVLAAWNKQWKKDQEIKVTGKGEATRDFIHVKDVVRAFIKAKDLSGSFEVGTGTETKIIDLAEMFVKNKQNGSIMFIPSRVGEPEKLVAKRSKFPPKWEPVIKLEKGIKDYE